MLSLSTCNPGKLFNVDTNSKLIQLVITSNMTNQKYVDTNPPDIISFHPNE